MKWQFLVLVVTLVMSAGCGGDDGDGAVEAPIADETTATTTTLAPTTTQTPIGVPFTAEEVLEVPGISDVVGSGSLVLTLVDGTQAVEYQNVNVPAVDGKITCPNCAGSIVMGGDMILPCDAFLDPDYTGETWYIVAGPEGATLDKVGAGFRLVEGEAFLVDDLSLVDPDYDAAAGTTTSTTEPTTTTVPVPKYRDIVLEYPVPATALCDRDVRLMSVQADGSWEILLDSPFMIFGGTYTSGDFTMIDPSGKEIDLPCWGMRIALDVPIEYQGSEYPAGSVVVVSPDADPATLETRFTLGENLLGPKINLGQPVSEDTAVIMDKYKTTWTPPAGLTLVRVACAVGTGGGPESLRFPVRAGTPDCP